MIPPDYDNFADRIVGQLHILTEMERITQENTEAVLRAGYESAEARRVAEAFVDARSVDLMSTITDAIHQKAKALSDANKLATQNLKLCQERKKVQFSEPSSAAASSVSAVNDENTPATAPESKSAATKPALCLNTTVMPPSPVLMSQRFNNARRAMEERQRNQNASVADSFGRLVLD